MRIANHAGRLALVEPDAESSGGLRGLDVERASDGRFAPTRRPSTTGGPSSGTGPRGGPRRRRPPGRGRPRPGRPAAAAGLRGRAELPRPRRRVGHGAADHAAGVHQVRVELHRPAGRHPALARQRRLGGRARRRHRHGRPPHPGGAGVGPRRRADRRPGHLRPRHPVRRPAPAVRDGQVLPRVLARWVRPSSASTSSARPASTPTTWSWAASSTARASRRAAPGR